MFRIAVRAAYVLHSGKNIQCTHHTVAATQVKSQLLADPLKGKHKDTQRNKGTGDNNAQRKYNRKQNNSGSKGLWRYCFKTDFSLSSDTSLKDS